jgi:hypothetical protein
VIGGRRRRREAELAARERFYAHRRYLRDDVTAFGEQLSELHVDTLTAVLDEEARDVYRHALNSYERAKDQLQGADDDAGLEPVVASLVEGRRQVAVVLARSRGEEPPQRPEECFFNPQHGPADADVRWTPPGGVERVVAVCRRDANRIQHGEPPIMRLVRVGDRHVPMVLARTDEDAPVPTIVDRLGVVEGKRRVRGQASLYGIGGNQAANDIGGFGSI